MGRRRREFKNFKASSFGVVRRGCRTPNRVKSTPPAECPPQLRNSSGLVGKIDNVTLKMSLSLSSSRQASCSGFKWIQASVSWTGGSQEFSVTPDSSAPPHHRIPGPLAVSSRCDNYHPALGERASLFRVLNNMFKT